MDRSRNWRHARALLAGGALLLPSGVTLAAQNGPLTEAREARIWYARGTGGTGYGFASIGLRYAILRCGGALYVGYHLVRGSVDVTSDYYINGDWLTASGGPAPQEPTVLSIKGRVRRNGLVTVRTFSNNPTTTQGFGCIGETSEIGRIADLVGAGATPEAVREYAATLDLIVDELPVTLRNASLESAHRQRLATAQRDSVAQARRDSSIARAEADSLARAVRQDSVDAVRRAEAAARAIERTADSLARARDADSTTRGGIRDSIADAQAAARLLERAKARQDSVLQARRTRELSQGERDAMRRDQAFFAQAEAAFQAGDTRTANAMFRRILSEPGYWLPEQRELARQRTLSIAGQIAVETTANASIAISRGLGVGVGFSYQQSWFDDDLGVVGFVMARDFGTHLYFTELHLGLAPLQSVFNATQGADPLAESERVQFGFRVGSSVPLLRIKRRGSAYFGPLVSYTLQKTNERVLNLGTLSLALYQLGGKSMLRLDATFVNGEPRFGGGFSTDF